MRVPIRNLLPPSVVVKGVDLDDIDMTLLTASIEDNGLLVPLTVCNNKIVDGYRRWLCCRAIGETEIEVHEVQGNPDELRIITQTRSTSIDRADRRKLVGDYLTRNREATADEIAHTFNWSPDEVESLAGIPHTIQPIRRAYTSGEVTLSEIWQLSRLRDEAQLEIWDDYRDSLYDAAKARLREERASRRRSMVSRERGKSFGAMQRERDNLTEAGLALIKAKAETPLDGWRACLDWYFSTK